MTMGSSQQGKPKRENKTGSSSGTHPLNMIYFYLTGDCNLACRHCWIAPSYQKKEVSQSPLDYSLFCSIVEQALPLGLGSVKLTGGEPLFHPQIKEILHHVRLENLHLNLESNGILLTNEIAALIAEGKDPFISISLDGVDAQTHEWLRGVPGSFNKTLRGVRTIVDAGVHPQIIMTLTRRNIHQIIPMIELAEREGAESIKFNNLLLIARGKSLHDHGDGLTIIELLRIGSMIEEDIGPTSSIPVIYSHPHAFRPLSRMFKDYRSCGNCNIHRILGVLHDGSYALCGIGHTVPEMVFGNATTERLSDVWKNHPVLKKIREDIPHLLQSPCRECLMKHFCLGSCVAQNFVMSNDLLASNWYCSEALKHGLFPATRLKL
jgi:SynChlorMet cassette radical SAM/SPASM protein ScmF